MSDDELMSEKARLEREISDDEKEESYYQEQADAAAAELKRIDDEIAAEVRAAEDNGDQLDITSDQASRNTQQANYEYYHQITVNATDDKGKKQAELDEIKAEQARRQRVLSDEAA